jgi:hypothetical protein
MALSKSAMTDLLDALRAGGDLDVIREGLAFVLQALIEAEATLDFPPVAGHSGYAAIVDGDGLRVV